MVFLAIHMMFIFDMSSQDIVFQSSNINPVSNPNEGIYLNQSGNALLDFLLMVNNENFDNDDNPYGKFVLH